MRIALALLLAITFNTEAQTVVTNWFVAAPNFRDVNGQLYNVELSALFHPLNARCMAVLTNGVVLQEFETNRTYAQASVNYAQSIGAYGAAPMRRLISEEIIPGKRFVLQNYPLSYRPTVGRNVQARGMLVGSINYAGEDVELYEYGKPHLYAVISTNKPPGQPRTNSIAGTQH